MQLLERSFSLIRRRVIFKLQLWYLRWFQMYMRETQLRNLKRQLNFTKLHRLILNFKIHSHKMWYSTFKSFMREIKKHLIRKELKEQQVLQELTKVKEEIRTKLIYQLELKRDQPQIQTRVRIQMFLIHSLARWRQSRSERIKQSMFPSFSCHSNLEFINALLFLLMKMLVNFSIQLLERLSFLKLWTHLLRTVMLKRHLP